MNWEILCAYSLCLWPGQSVRLVTAILFVCSDLQQINKCGSIVARNGWLDCVCWQIDFQINVPFEPDWLGAIDGCFWATNRLMVLSGGKIEVQRPTNECNAIGSLKEKIEKQTVKTTTAPDRLFHFIISLPQQFLKYQTAQQQLTHTKTDESQVHCGIWMAHSFFSLAVGVCGAAKHKNTRSFRITFLIGKMQAIVNKIFVFFHYSAVAFTSIHV